MKKRMYRTAAVVLCMALIFTILGAVPVSVSAVITEQIIWQQTPTAPAQENDISHGMSGFTKSLETEAAGNFERYTVTDAGAANGASNGGMGTPYCGVKLWGDKGIAPLDITNYTGSLKLSVKLRQSGISGQFHIYLNNDYDTARVLDIYGESNPIPQDGEWHEYIIDLSGYDWETNSGAAERFGTVIIAPRATWYDPDAHGSQMIDVKDAQLIYTPLLPIETIWQQTPTAPAQENDISHGMSGFTKSLETEAAGNFERYTVTDAGAANGASNGGMGTPYCGVKLWGDKGIAPLDITNYTGSLKLSVKLRQSGISGQFHIYLNNDYDTARVLDIYGESNPIPQDGEWHEYIIDLSGYDWETNSGAAERFGTVIIAPRATWYDPDAHGSQMIDVKDAQLIGVSNDATLSDLTFNGASIESFDANTETYNITVPYINGTVDIGATSTHEDAVVEGLGSKAFSDGAGTYNVTVTAPDGNTTKTYTISVIYIPDLKETIWKHTPTAPAQENDISYGMSGFTKSLETEAAGDFERYTMTNTAAANDFGGEPNPYLGIKLWGDKGVAPLDITNYTGDLKFSVKLRNNGLHGACRLYLSNDYDDQRVEINLSTSNPVPQDGTWHEYIIDLSDLPWIGNGAAERFGTVVISPYWTWFENGQTLDIKDAKLIGQRPVSDDADLTNLTLNGVNVKNFDPETLTYNCTVHYTDGTVNIGAEVSNRDAFATGLGDRPFANSYGTYLIVVHASDGSTKTYTINVTGGVSESVTFDSGYEVSGNRIKGVVPGTSAIQLIYETAAIGNSFITVIKNGNPVSGFELLTTGTIVKTMANGIETVYEIVIYMDVNGDGIINSNDIVDTKKHLLGVGDSLEGAYLSAAKCADDAPETIGVWSIVIMKKHLVSADAAQAFQVEFPDFHPGLPGYDALYTAAAKFSGLVLQNNEYNLVSKTAGVTVDGNKKVFVPESVWSKGGVVVLEATHIATQISKRIYLKYESPWKLSFKDDFDGNALDTDVWTIETGDVRQDNSYSICTPDSVIVENGKMILKAEKLSTPYNGKNYGHAIVNSAKAFSQKYGAFTARIKLPELGGVYGAFWLLPQGNYGTDNFFVATDAEDVRKCSEIDIMENFGPSANSGKVSSTLHFWNESAQVVSDWAKSNDYTIPNYDQDEFYEYSCIWTETAIYCFVDGKLFFSATDIAPDNSVAGYLMFSLFDAPAKELNSGYNYWYGDMYNAYYPQSMEVDWVKVYK